MEPSTILSLTSLSQRRFGTNASNTSYGDNGRLWLREAGDPSVKSRVLFQGERKQKLAVVSVQFLGKL